MNQEFQELYNNLNPAQKKAVDTIDGPVMVVAGPGTGKTQILAVRILNILQKTDARPQDILCITYTDAGASEMRQRLIKFLGPEAYRVNIYTFHGLCSEVISENYDYFNKGELQPLSELEKVHIIQELYDELPNENILKKFKPINDHIRNSLPRFFEFMKKEGYSVDTLVKDAKKEYEEVPLREDMIYKSSRKGMYEKGNPKTKDIKKLQDKLEKIIAAAECYNLYQKKLTERKRYDFADMILWVIGLFKDDPDILAEYQERFLYVLTDEFQDTSGAQKQLLIQLVNYWESPNLFVVGDEDQSIYRFQGANIQNIKELEDQFKQYLTKVVLENNYRSTQPILDLAAQFINQNEDRQVGDFTLQSCGLEVKDLEAKPKLVEYLNSYHEVIHIGEQVRKLIKKGVSPKEIAIIYPKHSLSDDFITYFRHYKVPVNAKRKYNVLDEPLVNKLITILEYVSLESQDPFRGELELFKLLHFDFFDISPLEIAELSSTINKSRTNWRTYLQKQLEERKKDLFAEADLTPILSVYTDTERWIKQAHNYTLPQLLEKIANNSGILSWAMNSEDSNWSMQVLHSFFDFVKEENAKNPKLTIQDLVRTIELMEINNITLPMSKIEFSDEGINLVTAHSSKGLEFEYVFLVQCQAGHWESKKSGTPFSIHELYSEAKDPKEAKIAELRRLFYVAMTRAKKELAISYVSLKLNGGPEKPSQFAEELVTINKVERVQVQVDADQLTPFVHLLFEETVRNNEEIINKELAGQKVKNLKISASALNAYMKCNLSYYFERIVGVPMAKNEYMAFGLAVHSTLQWYFDQHRDSEDKQFPSTEEATEKFIYFLYNNRDAHTEEAFRRRLDYGKKLIGEYLDARAEYFDKHNVTSTEKRFMNLEVDGVPITGVMDKIEFDGKKATLVDYKTGKPENAKDKLKPPSGNPDKGSQNGEDYWRQMVFYRILLENDRTTDWKYQDSYFDFIEPNENDEFIMETVTVSEEDMFTVRAQIKDTYTSITNLEFDQGCNEEKCFWCNFTKDHLAGKRVVTDELISLTEVEE
jgi:DNA helicase-2/ATP-dependent DNA helicase PcrA